MTFDPQERVAEKVYRNIKNFVLLDIIRCFAMFTTQKTALK